MDENLVVDEVLIMTGEVRINVAPGKSIKDFQAAGAAALDGACCNDVVVVRCANGKYAIGEFQFSITEVDEAEAERVAKEFWPYDGEFIPAAEVAAVREALGNDRVSRQDICDAVGACGTEIDSLREELRREESSLQESGGRGVALAERVDQLRIAVAVAEVRSRAAEHSPAEGSGGES